MLNPASTAIVPWKREFPRFLGAFPALAQSAACPVSRLQHCGRKLIRAELAHRIAANKESRGRTLCADIREMAGARSATRRRGSMETFARAEPPPPACVRGGGADPGRLRRRRAPSPAPCPGRPLRASRPRRSIRWAGISSPPARPRRWKRSWTGLIPGRSSFARRQGLRLRRLHRPPACRLFRPVQPALHQGALHARAFPPRAIRAN